ncbi:uncharacterized protein LAJ45_11219 [Morchella importuna]|uniref:uncharacterized protein n=1 Tax=Morchella importuna TaxID=1174673 RepID=UPI001E8E840A|nr:uncharacterized protein LAJ45_11219 [Morchella importuna]KAH8144784.1 hypothetical protein LAJ45_11219 [Morchella importuna]
MDTSTLLREHTSGIQSILLQLVETDTPAGVLIPRRIQELNRQLMIIEELFMNHDLSGGSSRFASEYLLQYLTPLKRDPEGLRALRSRINFNEERNNWIDQHVKNLRSAFEPMVTIGLPTREMSDIRIQLEFLKHLLNSMNKGSTFGPTALSPHTPTEASQSPFIQSSEGAREPLFPNADGDIESYRMNTEHFNGYVVHEEELSSGFRRKSTWDLKGEIERGSAGGVYLQRECERGTLRAVKAVILIISARFHVHMLNFLLQYDHLFVQFLATVACLNPILVKITDFGVSKQALGTFLTTRCGTALYSAPETIGIISSGLNQPKFPDFVLDICHSEYWTDLASLIQYCQDKLDFPTQTLRSSNIQDDAIEFVKGLLAGGPQDRPTAISTLSNPWLTGADGCLTFQKISD